MATIITILVWVAMAAYGYYISKQLKTVKK
jgi:hypothetical protein